MLLDLFFVYIYIPHRIYLRYIAVEYGYSRIGREEYVWYNGSGEWNLHDVLQ